MCVCERECVYVSERESVCVRMSACVCVHAQETERTPTC